MELFFFAQKLKIIKVNMTKRIAIQGYPGAFHEIASCCYYSQKAVEVVPADTFGDLVELVEAGTQVDGGLMAIENTIAGSLLNNYQLLNNSSLEITGEIFLRIRQNLMALPGQKISDLKEVHSHPIAIEQCRPFFKKYPQIKLVAMEDTALSAKRIREGELTGIGAIASTLAADRYKMDLLAEGIETNKKNFTRFLVLDKEVPTNLPAEINKVSICFSAPHKAGSLYAVLKVLADYRANMTKVQSVPMIGEAWRYIFFIDFLLERYSDLSPIKEQLAEHTVGLKILGKYREGMLYDS